MKQRLFWPDLIRAVACVCVVLCHFNAAVSENFTIEQGIGWNFPLDIYIGTVGVNLFFMISGAMLMYVRMSRGKEKLFRFYKKRFLTIYPMYWIVYFIAISVSFFVWGWLPNDSWIWILNALSGFNGYLFVLGITPFAFYQIGEWFLGCIVCLYIIAPILLYLIDEYPKRTIVTSFAVCVLLVFRQVHPQFFVMYIPHFLIGMVLIKYADNFSIRISFLALILIGVLYLFPYKQANGIIYSFLVCVCLFVILKEVGCRMKSVLIKDIINWLAKYSYAIFLVHHKLIDLLVLRFDLNYLGERGIILLFLIYCVLTAIISVAIHLLNDRLYSRFSYYISKRKC